MKHIDRLLLRTELDELNVEFAYRIDHGLSDQVADLFTEDGSYGRSTGERSVGRDAIRRAYATRSDRGPRTARHVFTNLRLTEVAEDRVEATSILTLFAHDGPPPHAAEPLLVADYDDTYRRGADGRWRFASRTVTWLFRHPGGAASPLRLGSTEATR
jgi:ketosteroid isomerase-like protein